MQNPKVLADSEDWAMVMSLCSQSTRALILTPLITISELDLDRDDSELESTVAKVGHMTTCRPWKNAPFSGTCYMSLPWQGTSGGGACCSRRRNT